MPVRECERPSYSAEIGCRTGNPGVIQGLPVPVPSGYLHPCTGYRYSRVRVEGTTGRAGQKTHVGFDDGSVLSVLGVNLCIL
jgi:hypothetical protein